MSKDFLYVKTTRSAGFQRLFFGLLAYFIFLFIGFNALQNENELVRALGWFFVLASQLPTLINIYKARKEIKSTGEWRVSITDQKISWLSPDNLGDSFEVDLSEIEYVRSYPSDDHSDAESKHYLLLNGGERQFLPGESKNININIF